MKTNLSIDIAVIISLFTVFFYTCGQTYLAAYMAVFYIDPVILNFSTTEKINWGFLNCANWLTYILFMALTLSFFLYVFALIDLKYPQNLFKTNKQRRPHIHNLNSTEEQRKNRIRVFFWIFFISILTVFAFITFANIDIKTSKSARKILKNPTSLPLIRVNDQYLFLIKCGSSLCAAIDKNKNVSLIEPKNVILVGSNFKNK